MNIICPRCKATGDFRKVEIQDGDAGLSIFSLEEFSHTWYMPPVSAIESNAAIAISYFSQRNPHPNSVFSLASHLLP
jgi:hypothetical protein